MRVESYDPIFTFNCVAAHNVHEMVTGICKFLVVFVARMMRLIRLAFVKGSLELQTPLVLCTSKAKCRVSSQILTYPSVVNSFG